MPSVRRALLASFALFLPAVVSAQTIVSFTPTTAAAGSTVIITGTALSQLKSVQLNGLTMRVTASSAISVSVVVPPAAATGKLRLTTASGTVLSSTKLGITRQSSAVSYSNISTSVTGGTATGNYSTPTAGDINANGKVDLLMGQGDGTIMMYEQTTAGQAALGTGVLLLNASGSTLDVGSFAKPTIADLDGDGLLELIVGEDTGNVLRYEQVAATGTDALKFNVTTLFTNPFGTATNSAPNGGSYARPGVSDLDNDGLLDILVGSNDGTLRRYEQATPNASTTAGFNALGLMKLADGTTIDAGDVDKPLLTDYNGDGYLDMLLGNKAGNIMLYTQSGRDAATFTAVGNLSTAGTAATVINMGSSGTNPSSMGGYAAPAITDIDGDGLLDLYVGNGNGSIYRYEQTQSASVPTLTAPLPVVLTSFTGQATSAGNQLSWATAQEVKSASFVIEASADGSTFAAVAELAAAGNSTSARTYQYLDASAAAQSATRRYYRLRQVDLDGSLTYSTVVVLSRTVAATSSTFEAYPNPFANQLTVALPGAFEPQAATITLLSLAGRPVYTGKLTLSAAPQALVALPELPAGVYVLRLTTASGTISHKVTRQ
ncbi:T9SS type A sorting domain-containing protein [Hymenobacter negativus]|uniref:T9SS type A sorting domain-containing protein n=1 Tax=Hymenobacter negativus TaxID=2795026 RepID=A0ABS3QIU3_9BACT|nr:T9SS type A sorting domain-containing protein [Hymenobacter negativus]MBO2010704.1 T9SS type A sorting domain-containing protein [Hymenobacter negativus]